LQNENRLEEARRIAQRAKTVELATHPYFLERFIEVMAFGETFEDGEELE
jgi:uncharacterized 2Fe-2S/4Fe-4S cluster protein (DUF4445 family)